MMENIANFSAIFAIFAIWVFSPGPNEIFAKAKNWAMENFARNEKHPLRFVFQIVFCPWCSAIIFAVISTLVFRENFWIALAVCEFTATLTIFGGEK